MKAQRLRLPVGASVDVGGVDERRDLIDLIARPERAVLVRRRTGADKVQAGHVERPVERVIRRYKDRHAVRMPDFLGQFASGTVLSTTVRDASFETTSLRRGFKNKRTRISN